MPRQRLEVYLDHPRKCIRQQRSSFVDSSRFAATCSSMMVAAWSFGMKWWLLVARKYQDDRVLHRSFFLESMRVPLPL